ncbi:MAG: nucleotidyl transferase AbiEii/AbiGii toxin family protein [bacterium]
MSGLLDREALLGVLSDLGGRLDARGIAVELYVVGGTAMMLAYDRARLTRDIDATWDASVDLSAEIRAIAAERGLPGDWLNDRVRPLLPRLIDEERLEALDIPGLMVSVASPRHMIAMKARAARDARDLDDLALLCGREGITTVDEVIEICDAVWGAGMRRDDVLFTLRTALPERGLRP